MWWYVMVTFLLCVVYIIVIKPMGHWKKRRIPYKKPWPVLGNMAPILFRQKSFVEILKDLYNDFPDQRYNGIYAFTSPQLLIRDPELIKQLTIKDFDHFMDHTTQVTDEIEPILSKNLGSLHGQKWRDMRATLSPSFTSSKMRFMFTLISDCAEQFTKHFEEQGSNVISVEMKEVFSRFTNDVIATAAFGITVDSLKEKNNEFFLIGKDVTSFGGLRGLRLFGYSIFPALMRFFKVTIFPRRISDFFRRIVEETIEVREKNGIVRPDMIHLLLETRKGKTEKEDLKGVSDTGFAVVEEAAVGEEEHQKKLFLTDEDITAQAMIFFFAGFETSSTLMSFMSHELAVNSDVQKKLQEEIDETLEECNGKITYEALLRMKYLDMVVSESLRKWPPGIGLDRICVKDYVIAPKLPNEETFTVEKGTTLSISVVGLHHDPKYFPNPDKFNPDRFSEENKSKIVPSTYLPFGTGPRSCIEKTPIPLILSRKKLNLVPDEGFWLGLQQRKKTN